MKNAHQRYFVRVSPDHHPPMRITLRFTTGCSYEDLGAVSGDERVAFGVDHNLKIFDLTTQKFHHVTHLGRRLSPVSDYDYWRKVRCLLAWSIRA